MQASIIIVTREDQNFLNRLLVDLSNQDTSEDDFEILILEAGQDHSKKTRFLLKEKSKNLKYFHVPNLGREASLNRLIEYSSTDLIIRLDSRSSITKDYLSKIIKLSGDTQAENVGGVMLPVHKNEMQRIIAYVMRSRLSFGGAKFRDPNFKGYVDTLYLGAFNKSKIFMKKWFDEDYQGISEDSDLNYRIQKSGGKIFLDSSIIVEHYPRETIRQFFRLCFNYGKGRGLFIIKHKSFAAYRRLIPIIFYLYNLIMITLSFKSLFFLYMSLGSLIIYLVLIFSASFEFKLSLLEKIKFSLAIIGCHFFWTSGLFSSIKDYIQIKKHLIK